MEVQPLAEDVQAIAHQHATGEIFAANNLETARNMCPVLGKMSLEEAGLLLELEAMGREQIAEPSKIPPEKPVIEKVEKIRPELPEVRKAAETVAKGADSEAISAVGSPASKMAGPATDEIGTPTFSKSHESGALLMQRIRQAEAAHAADESSKVFEEAGAVQDKAVGSAAQLEHMRNGSVHDHADREIVETRLYQDALSTEELPSVAAAQFAFQHSQILSERPLEGGTLSEDTAIGFETVPAGVQLLPAENAAIEPVVYETTTAMAGFGEDVPMHGLVETDENIATFDRLEQGEREYGETEATIPGVIETGWLDDGELAGSAQIESALPLALPELPAPVIQVEAAVAQLLDVIGQSETTESGKIDAMLEKIVALPAEHKMIADESMETLAAELGESFIELFEAAHISHSPELVESFARLTTTHHLESLEIFEDAEEEAQVLPDEIGTREFLQKLQRGLGAMKQAAASFYEIGKSVLRLYAYGFEAATANSS